jgi:ribulose-phosphate 3-epimerase
MMVDQTAIEVVPAILRATWEGIREDWDKVAHAAAHIQIDITDGVFAGDGTFRQIRDFKKLPKSQKAELHFMVHTPAHYVDDIIDMNPARCIFHVESFAGTNDLRLMYTKLRSQTQAQLALALNPESPTEWLEEHLELVDYVMFMGYSPGWANQPIQEIVFNKIRAFAAKHPEVPIAVDGHVSKATIPTYVEAGARILCANTSIFGEGEPSENIEQLRLWAEQHVLHRT